MPSFSFKGFVAGSLGMLTVVALSHPRTSAQASSQPPAPDGAALYASSCATCHDGGNDRAPGRDALMSMTPDRVLAAMERGPMITMANNRSAVERRAIAEFVTGKRFGDPLVTTPAPQAMCSGSPSRFDSATGPRWSGWGHDTSNTRFQDSSNGGVTASNVGRLKLKWAFAFPGDLQSYAQATLAGGRIFTGSWGGTVYSLDADTGCVHWYYQADAGVRGAVAIGRTKLPSGPRDVAFFGDVGGHLYAVDAATGAPLWKTKADEHPAARVNGSPVFYNGRIYVGVASGEEAAGSVPTYECCRFRGSLVALDAATGRQIWKTFVVDEPKPTKKNAMGTQMWGPSGAGIWATPAIDPKRNAIYITTGNNYSDPPSPMSDSFVAMDLDTGKILWWKQMTQSDAYVSACRLQDRTNCADSNGPDFDFGASPILTTLANGRRVLLAGQKSGMVHALDPDRNGDVIWQARVGHGGTMGGVQWGSAVDRDKIYVALSDIRRIALNYSQSTEADPKEGGGMFALRLDSGERVWMTPPPGCGTRTRCSPAQSAAVSAAPGLAFSGSVDGHMRAYSTADGKVLWDFDTIRDYQAVNGVPARGGSIDGPGPVIGGGMVFFTSGYPTAGGMPGNVLLAFKVEGR